MSNIYPAQFEETTEEYYDCGYAFDKSTGFAVTFRDIPSAITQGDNFSDALKMAQDALKTAVEFYNERGEDCPKASAPQTGDVIISCKEDK